MDSVEAKECGDSIAFFKKDYGTDFIDSLTQEIQKCLKVAKTDRIYVVYIDTNTNLIKGKFLFGGRKRAPWEGYATKGQATEEDN